MTDAAATAWLQDHEQYINHQARTRCAAQPDDAAQEARIEVLRVFRSGKTCTDGYLRTVVIRRIQALANGSNKMTTVHDRRGSKVYDMMSDTRSHRAPRVVDFTDPEEVEVSDTHDHADEVLGKLTAHHMVRNLTTGQARHALARANGLTTADLAHRTGAKRGTLDAEWRVIRARLREELAA